MPQRWRPARTRGSEPKCGGKRYACRDAKRASWQPPANFRPICRRLVISSRCGRDVRFSIKQIFEDGGSRVAVSVVLDFVHRRASTLTMRAKNRCPPFLSRQPLSIKIRESFAHFCSQNEAFNCADFRKPLAAKNEAGAGFGVCFRCADAAFLHVGIIAQPTTVATCTRLAACLWAAKNKSWATLLQNHRGER